MSELRAPDPTLTAYASAVQVDLYRPLPVAHLDADTDPPVAPCGREYEPPAWKDELATVGMSSLKAAYIAVPCRECFPDAPPPGTLKWCCGSDECGRGVPSEGLSWQRA